MTVDEIMARIRDLESGHNYRAANPQSSARGAYQFIRGTWQSLTRRYGIGTQYAEAHLAPPEIQDAVARRYVQSILDSNGGDIQAVPAIWYTGRYDPNNLDYVPGASAGNTKTVRQYITRFYGGSTPATAGGAAATAAGGGQVALTREQLAARVRDQYPAWAWLLNEPEIGNLLLEAVDPAKGFDEATLKARLYATNWWKNNSEPMRMWQTLANTDPMEAESRIQETGEMVQQRARVLGVTIDFKTAREIATASLLYGWTGEFAASKIDRILIDRYSQTGGGLIGSTEDQIRAEARSYLIRLTDAEAKKLAASVARGDDTVEGLRATFSDQAKALFPQIAPAIEAGRTVADFVAPYQRVAAELLEVSPDSIDFTDPKYLTALNGGEGRLPLSLADWQTKIRTDDAYGWKRTAQAKQQAWGIGADLLKRFGAHA